MSSEQRDRYVARARRAARSRRLGVATAAAQQRARDRRWWRLRRAPGMAAVASGGGGPRFDPGWGGRGIITEWSARSKFKLMCVVASIDWPDDPLVLITLTYPQAFPHDAAIFKEHLRRFQVAVERRLGKARGLWAMEFQRRGAPHYHIALVIPRGMKVAVFGRWVAHTWYGIAGDGDGRHLQQHLKPDHCKLADGPRGLVGYLRRELGKTRQKTLPAWLANPTEEQLAIAAHRRCTSAHDALDHLSIPEIVGGVDDVPRGAGRWWGLWGLDRADVADVISEDEFHILRRILRRLNAARGFRRRAWASLGVTSFDRARRRWALAESMAHFLAGLRGHPPPRASFLALDSVARQLALGLPT
jgi:hypothetical protein